MKRVATFLTAAVFAAFATPALAGPSDDAQKHFQAIAAGDAAAASAGYAENARLEWVGGPLDGSYAGGAIAGVWEKFTKAQGALTVAVDKVEESANPKGGTVTANVVFTGKQPIKVRYVLTYRDGKIASETWQIDPKLAMK